jgi:NAD(P)-dependent dehydrogenase (short-subunit alcohol dehydrogenase family)
MTPRVVLVTAVEGASARLWWRASPPPETGWWRSEGTASFSRRSGAAETEVCDVTDEPGVEELFRRLGPSTSSSTTPGASASAPLGRTTLEDWRLLFEVNATGAFLCTRAVLPGMIERADGRIVTVASVAGLAGSRYTAAYTASKHAAVGLMRASPPRWRAPA